MKRAMSILVETRVFSVFVPIGILIRGYCVKSEISNKAQIGKT
jgi:hypothetical protein